MELYTFLEVIRNIFLVISILFFIESIIFGTILTRKVKENNYLIRRTDLHHIASILAFISSFFCLLTFLISYYLRSL